MGGVQQAENVPLRQNFVNGEILYVFVYISRQVLMEICQPISK